MSIEIVRGELERLFSLEELLALSGDLLSFSPGEVGGTASKASFAKALVERCVETQATMALVDAMVGSRGDVDPRVKELQRTGISTDVELKAGSTFAGYTITRKIADGPRATIFAARKDDTERALKVYKGSATTDSAAVRRFLAQARLIGRVRHESLPEGTEVGIEDGRVYVGYKIGDAQPLATRVARSGALHLNEARPLVRGILGALGALHEARLAHGNVKLENVLVGRTMAGAPLAILVDGGADRLVPNARDLGQTWPLRASSPEQLRGKPADVASDIYTFGTLIFELLSGKPPFPGSTGADLVAAQLALTPSPVSSVAPRGWVTKEIDEIVARLLDKTPDRRPKSVKTVLAELDAVGKPAGTAKISQEDFDSKVDALVADPNDHNAAMELESAIESGADPTKVADAFAMAAESVELEEGDEARSKGVESKKSLIFRAARILENAKESDRAEELYTQICELDPADEVAQAALEELRRSAGKFEELIEALLERSEKSESHSERARCLNQIGHLYVRELDDREQGVFAYAQALAQEVQNDEYAGDLERAAGSDMKLWADALQILSEVTTHPRMPPETKASLFVRLGHWYSDKVARPDLGLPCFQAVLPIDPANEGALSGMTGVYRRAQQWNELGQVLLRRADRAPTPERARAYRAEAADLLETKLNDPGRARDLFEQIIAEDPGHDAACEALTRIYKQLDDKEGLAKILERRAEALRGEARVEAICKIAELYENELDNLPEAFRRYEAALDLDAASLTALRGLDRILNRQGRYGELLEVLERQLKVAATPRQKINLLERMAGVYEEEFLDHVKAAETLERVLELDPSHAATLASLLRHYRALDRWEDVVTGHEKMLKLITDDKTRIDALLSMGRVLVEQIGSPQRAQKIYERVLELDPKHTGALESLANVRVATGDADAALSAVEALASKAEKADQKSDLWVRAAKMLEDKGDKDGAIERYKAALDALPSNTAAAHALRQAYLARGDAASAVELITREIETSDGKIGKARLYGEMALLLRDKVRDTTRAADAAKKAVDLDPTSLPGHMVTGDIAFEAGRFIEASKSYENVVGRADTMNKTDAQRVLMRYMESLAKTGSSEKAKGQVELLLKLAPDAADAVAAAARVHLDAGDHKRAATLYADVLERFDDKLTMRARADALIGLGTARLHLGELDAAVPALSEASDLDPESNAPLELLAKVYEKKGDWEELIRMKTRGLDALTGEARTSLLLEIGDIYSAKLNDRTRASKSYVAALDERPEDRKVLTKLMQLYSEEKDWSRLVDIVLKLASMVSDAKQKAKYLHTAAIVAGRQMGELERAAKFYDDVLELDPSLEKALVEAIDVRSQLNDHEGVERLVKIQLDQATDLADRDKMLASFDKLAALYRDKLGWTTEAIDAYEAAQTLDPDNTERNEILAALYASDPAQYLDKAVAAQRPILRKNPNKPEGYRLLRKLYTEAKQADAAWCLCQALVCLNLAEPDEERFYRRMRPEGPAAAQSRLGNDEWDLLMHPDADPLVTQIFQLIEPAVLKRNGQPLEALGYQAAYALDLIRHPYPMSQTLYYAAGVLGMDPPPTFQNPEDPSGLAFLHAHTPGIVLGQAALALELPTQPAAFVAARHLTYYRQGLYIRQIVPTGTGLRAWLFAAIRLVVPAFPVAPELEGPVGENIATLEKALAGPVREQLVSAVTKLLQAGAIDLKKWVAGVDLSADRAGLILANDLELALELLRAGDGDGGVANRERNKELLLFSVSEEFFTIRKALGINIDA
ncbi:MAG: protein kinase [Polyangiaceae bacterium]|nr:protein kinase [Polyangiaceae bacterium]